MSIEAERLRRIHDAWLADEPSSFEIAHAERRYRERRSQKSGVWYWGVIGAGAGLIAMLAVSVIARPKEDLPAHGSITAEPAPDRAPAPLPALPAVTETASPPSDSSPAKPTRPKSTNRARTASATEPSEPTPTAPRDENALRDAPRWLSVGPVITGLEHETGVRGAPAVSPQKSGN